MTSTDTSIYGVIIAGSPSASESFVIADNTFTNFWDCIGTGGNKFGDGIGWNGDIARNYFVNYLDDATELEGDFNNVRFWRNTILSTNSYSLLGLSGVYVGPCFIVRNVFNATGASANVIGLKNEGAKSPGPIYFVHNDLSTYETTAGGAHETVSGSTNIVLLNNIIQAHGNILYSCGTNTQADYDLYWIIGSTLVSAWHGNNYDTLPDFTTATGREAHGINADPLLGADYTLGLGSPAIGAGVVIPNLNDATSAWPSTGAPDIGAYEYVP